MEELTKEQEDYVLEAGKENELEENEDEENMYPYCEACDNFVEIGDYNFDMNKCEFCITKDDAIFDMMKDEMVEKEIEDNKDNTH